jgi:hypothetical protein
MLCWGYGRLVGAKVCLQQQQQQAMWVESSVLLCSFINYTFSVHAVVALDDMAYAASKQGTTATDRMNWFTRHLLRSEHMARKLTLNKAPQGLRQQVSPAPRITNSNVRRCDEVPVTEAAHEKRNKDTGQPFLSR